MQNNPNHVTQEVSPSRNWIGYLKWLGVKVEGPQAYRHKEREDL